MGCRLGGGFSRVWKIRKVGSAEERRLVWGKGLMGGVE